MLMRLRFIGDNDFIAKGSVWYMRVKQLDNLHIVMESALFKPGSTLSYEYVNLEQFLKHWKILSIDKKVANARVHHK